MGRFTLPDLLGLSPGVTVFLVTLMGLFALWGAEQIEGVMRRKDGLEVRKTDRWVSVGAGVLALAGLGVMLIGQPTPEELWQKVAAEKQPLLDNREVQIHPAELRDVYFNPLVNLVMIDVRDEADYNLFHIKDAERVPLDQLADMAPELKAGPPGTVVVLMSNDETKATEGWKILTAMGVPNTYILEGGLNNFISTCSLSPFKAIEGSDEMLRFEFDAALGANHPMASLREHGKEIEYTPKVKIEKQAPTGGGGCG
jgi:rhodanese-related sulfurtransferase